jgi:lipid-A-disaccharide synthase-like uncharacterized protein
MHLISEQIFSLKYLWLLVGFTGQFLFAMRFIWQWVQSEKHKKSIIPIAFWYFSIAGGLILLAYAIHIGDPIFILGQLFGSVIYIRNLYFIYREQKENLQSVGA